MNIKGKRPRKENIEVIQPLVLIIMVTIQILQIQTMAIVIIQMKLLIERIKVEG